MIVKLLDAVDTDTNGTGVAGDGAERLCHIYGTDFDGGTVTLQMATDGGTVWTTILQADGSAAAFTAAVFVLIAPYSPSVLLRATLTGSTTPVDVTAELS